MKKNNTPKKMQGPTLQEFELVPVTDPAVFAEMDRRCRAAKKAMAAAEEADKRRSTRILIRFPNIKSKRSALAQLAGRFDFESWAGGEMHVPEDALVFLTAQGIPFISEGPANLIEVL